MRRMVVGVLLAVLFLAGCGGNGGASQPYATTALGHTTASNLDMVLSVFDEGTDSKAPHNGIYQIEVSAFVDHAKPMDTRIQFTKDEAVVCNGVRLALNTGVFAGFKGMVTTVKPGGMLTCVYSANGEQTTFAYLTPPEMSILNLHDDAMTGGHEQRSKNFPIKYTPVGAQYGSASVIAYVNALGHAIVGQGPVATSKIQPDTGTCIVDTTSLPSGEANVYLEREFDASPTTSGFKSLKVAFLQELMQNAVVLT